MAPAVPASRNVLPPQRGSRTALTRASPPSASIRLISTAPHERARLRTQRCRNADTDCARRPASAGRHRWLNTDGTRVRRLSLSRPARHLGTAKQWPKARYAAAIDALSNDGVRCAPIGAVPTLPPVAMHSACSRLRSPIDLVGATDLPMLTAVLVQTMRAAHQRPGADASLPASARRERDRGGLVQPTNVKLSHARRRPVVGRACRDVVPSLHVA